MPLESAWQTQDQSNLLLMWFACSHVCVCTCPQLFRTGACAQQGKNNAGTSESPGTAPVLNGCNFWVEPEDTGVKTWKFPSLAREAGVGVALCPLSFCCFCVCRCLSVWDVFVWADSVVSSSGGWDMFTDAIDFSFVLLFPPKNSYLYFILVLLCPILWFGKHINKTQIYKKAIPISFMFLMPRFCSIIAIFPCAFFSQANKLNLMRSFSLCEDLFSMKRET